MKITIFQQDIVWNNPQTNRQKAEQAISSMPGSDLYVFPEMFCTGFNTNPQEIAEPEMGETLQWMLAQSEQAEAAIAATIAVKDGNKYVNRFYFVEPNGNVSHYDKHHLFSYGGENHHFSSGAERVVVEFRGVRFLLQTCYDLRFPVFSRNRQDYDVVIYAANWPESRVEAWRTLLRARAIENQCFAIGVNRVGNDPACQYSGSSAIISPYGRALFECMPHMEQIGCCEINLEKLRAFREKFPVLKDSDSWELKTNS